MFIEYYSVIYKWQKIVWESFLCVEFIKLGLSPSRQEGTQRNLLYGSQVILRRQVISRELALAVLLSHVNPFSSADSRCLRFRL
jgi:hypothetical protein